MSCVYFSILQLVVHSDFKGEKKYLQRAVYIASDGGRVCRPLVIADKGISRIKEHHMKELSVSLYLIVLEEVMVKMKTLKAFMIYKDGVRSFDDFLRDGLIEYLDVNEENNAMVCS